MNINFNEITNEADIWLTANEKNNEMITELLGSIYADCKKKNCKVTVFISGKKDLNGTVLPLLMNQLNDGASA